MPDSDYVTAAAWRAPAGRPDHVDEIADQFERPTEPDAVRAGVEEARHWPRRSRGWRTADRAVHHRIPQRHDG